MRSKLTPAWQAFVDANPELLLITLTIGALQDRLRDSREQGRDRGALSTEQAIITAALVTLAAGLIVVIAAVVKKNQANIK
jgi:hypothetical protein